ncbi:MAG: LacI family DNA-binding transcriptional regulator [Pseudomonadota bacterium]
MGRRTTDKPTLGVGRVRGRRRVTMMDVAREARCSQSTVSFVLNDNTSVQISKGTRERVLTVARELGYEGIAVSGSKQPASDRPGTIAFIVDTLSASWEAVTALDGLQQAAAATGSIVLAAETQNNSDLEPRLIAAMTAQGVQAIVYGCTHTRAVRPPAALSTTDIPVFLLNCYTEDDAYPAVIPSEIAGGQRATQALIDAGHRRIATITGELYMEAANDRLTGYRRALATADIPYDPALVKDGDWSISAGFQAASDLLDGDSPPTAIFCQSDRMAIGCYEALKERGQDIPGDVSIVGYDDQDIARHLMPPLTTMILPQRAMGQWVIEQLANGRRERAALSNVTKLECELVERLSVAPPARR